MKDKTALGADEPDESKVTSSITGDSLTFPATHETTHHMYGGCHGCCHHCCHCHDYHWCYPWYPQYPQVTWVNTTATNAIPYREGGFTSPVNTVTFT